MHNRLIMTRPKKLEYYKGMLIHADTDVHDQAIALFRQYVPIGSQVIDVGAGAGAFSRRLVDTGYVVTALDMDIGEWVPRDIPFVRLDINSRMSGCLRTTFDAACCLEVIEHIENPWSLLREIYALLKPGGRLILSTPNITSFLSRLVFLRTGKFHQFSESDLSYGHISPITAFELSTIAHRVGWKILEIRPGGYLPLFDFTSFNMRSLVLNIMRGLIYASARGQKQGWCLFFIMEKPY